MKSEYFDCACSDFDDVIRFVYEDEDDGFIELYLEIHLNGRISFFRRIWNAVKYIFGVKTKYGNYGNWILSYNDVDRLQAMLKKYKDAKQKRNDKVVFGGHHDHQCPACGADIRRTTLDCPNPKCAQYVNYEKND
jgi:hypothetical protein